MYSILRLQKHTNAIKDFKKKNSEKHFAQRFDIAIITKYEILPILFCNLKCCRGDIETSCKTFSTNHYHFEECTCN